MRLSDLTIEWLWPWATAAVIIPLVVIGLYLAYLQISGNFHVSIDGQLYRSAQPTAAALRKYATFYGVRTVINLRGKNEQDKWYRDEVAEARLLGLQHIDFKMSARKELSLDQVKRLVVILREAPKPILIHCQSGSDRSGLVAAIYLHEIGNVDVEKAEKQISLYYGHIGIPYFSKAYAMDKTWEQLEAVYRNRTEVPVL